MPSTTDVAVRAQATGYVSIKEIVIPAQAGIHDFIEDGYLPTQV